MVWNDTRINIVDTPGHADFGGEVERILSMVDGAIVLVDAAEGVLPQTKFVVGKALARGLQADRGGQQGRPRRRPAGRGPTEVFDLFAALGATDEQLDFPDAVRLRPPGLGGRDAWTVRARIWRRCSTWCCATCRRRRVDPDAPFAMVATILDYDNFLGRVLTGRLEQGRARLNMPVKVLRADGAAVETGRLTKLLAFRGLDRVPVEEAEAGRHHRRRRPDRGDGAGHDRRAGAGGPAAREPDRSADPGDDVPHQ